MQKTKLSTYVLLLFLSFLFSGCTTDDIVESNPQMVVEGWIESGGNPYVRVTTTIPISKEYQSTDSLDRFLLESARVCVSDGTTTAVLRGVYSKRYTPSFIFSTDKIFGVPGRSYTLTVDYENFHASAVTTIPEPVAVDSFRIEPVQGNDTLFHIRAFIHDTPTADNYYRFLVRDDEGRGSKEFLPAYLGVFSSSMIREGGVFVNQGRNNIAEEKTNSYFTCGEKVQFKLAHIDFEAYNFWCKFEDVANFSRVPTLSGDYTLPGNVTGALGYWFGYGVRAYSAEMPDYDSLR